MKITKEFVGSRRFNESLVSKLGMGSIYEEAIPPNPSFVGLPHFSC